MRVYRQRRREEDAGEFLAAARVARSERRLVALGTAAVQRFGGPAGFATALKRHLDGCPAGSARGVRGIFGLLRFLFEAERLLYQKLPGRDVE